MNEEIKSASLSISPEPEKLLLRDGTCFIRKAEGAYGGSPTPGQIGEIQGQFSDHSKIGLVRARKDGELPAFEIDYFQREN